MLSTNKTVENIRFACIRKPPSYACSDKWGVVAHKNRVYELDITSVRLVTSTCQYTGKVIIGNRAYRVTSRNARQWIVTKKLG